MESFEKILSVIVPAYNMEAYLPKCLSSLVIDDKQLLRKLDVIVVNDGSKDRTSEIAHEFEVKYPDVFRVVDKSNGNYGSCVNVALLIASGVFVKILDADDSFDTNAFTQMLYSLVESECNSEKLDLLLTDFVKVDEVGKDIDIHRVQLSANTVFTVRDIKKMPLLYMHSITYRMENLRRIGYRQTEGISYTDNEWIFYPMQTVKTVKYVPLPVYRYLLGRVGQTVDPSVIKKSTWVMAVIAERINSESEKLLTNVSAPVLRKYLKHIIIMMNEKVYNGVILDLHSQEDDKRLVMFDNRFEAMAPEMHKCVINLLVSHKMRFRYGIYWRHYHSSNVLGLRLFRVYIFLIRFISNFLHRHR